MKIMEIGEPEREEEKAFSSHSCIYLSASRFFLRPFSAFTSILAFENNDSQQSGNIRPGKPISPSQVGRFIMPHGRRGQQ